MGVICVLLGIITFLAFTAGGALVANAIIDFKVKLSASFIQLAGMSNTTIMVGVICVFTFIGLISGLSLVMHGLTYNKVSKMYRMARRKAGK